MMLQDDLFASVDPDERGRQGRIHERRGGVGGYLICGYRSSAAATTVYRKSEVNFWLYSKFKKYRKTLSIRRDL